MCAPNSPEAVGTPSRLQFRAEPFHQDRRRPGIRGIGERRPPPLAAVRMESELAHHKRRSSHIEQRQVGLAAFILEYP